MLMRWLVFSFSFRTPSYALHAPFLLYPRMIIRITWLLHLRQSGKSLRLCKESQPPVLSQSIFLQRVILDKSQKQLRIFLGHKRGRHFIFSRDERSEER